ncbi:TetR/AcrR family transcriptional regulator [Nonomuraea sp. NN258]|uniref:TetR/AcrR family transcriptional regulator n=1 Tax=Nonomuraea antri TaxID=2730852 RepID=UPI00156837B2|nr:TetR/AcrR family transcriptional regulator [Nonomuraea antri]NRQ38781.1 TetR/AcrR family transcriptional regulator [Nonomuraea antri]
MERESPAVKGRPRDPDLDARVLRAALELVVEVGYQQTSIDAIARRAGVSRPAVYRRWRAKSDIVAQALFGRSAPAEVRVTGDLRRDLRAWVDAVLARFGGPAMAHAFLGLMADLRDRGDRRFRLDLVQPRRDHLARTLAQPGARPGVDQQVFLELLVGAVFLRVATGHDVSDPAYAEELTDLLHRAVAVDPGGRPS